MRQFVFAAAALALAGCVQNTVEMQNSFDPNEGRYILQSGSGSIEGQAFMRQAGGDVVTCAGEDVSLTPVTPYFQERIQIIYGSPTGGSRTTVIGDVPPDHASGSLALRKMTKCDASGNFQFTNLAPGSYFVSTQVVWMASQYNTQGGVLAQRVEVAPGQRVRTILN